MLGFRRDNSEQKPVQSGTPVSATPPVAGAVQAPVEESGAKRLGQILIEEGEITRAHLEEALRIQEEKGGFLGQILVDLNYVKQETVVSSLVKQCKIPHLSLLDYEITKEVLQLVPQEICLRYSLLPIDKLGRILTVAMVNPLDTAALEELRRLYPELRIKPILCDWQHFKTVMARNFGQPAQDQQEAVFDIASFGPGVKGKKMMPAVEPAPAPEPEAVAPMAEPDPCVIAALDQAVSAIISSAAPSPDELALAPMAAPAAIPAAAVSGVSPQDVTAMMRESIAGIMQETMASLVVSAKTAPGAMDMAPQQLAEMVRDGVAAAMQETLATFAVQMQSMAVSQQPHPDDSVAVTLQETLANLTVQVQALAQQRPAENLAGAMRETLAGLTEQIQAAAQQARPSEALAGNALQHLSDLTAQVQALVQQRPAAEDLAGVVHSTLADLSVQMQALAQQRPAAENLAAAVRDGVAAALQGGLTPSVTPQDIASAIKEALKPGQNPAPSTLVMGPDMAEALKSGIREALRENESAAVARANRLELEARDSERIRRTKHASVSPFALTRRRVHEAMDNPELRAEGDQRVLSAMHTDRLLPEYTFDGFYPGTANEFTYKLCKSVAARPGSEFNPFFLYGEVGLGKTHLVNAVGNDVMEEHPDARVGYVSASRFAGRLSEALRDCALDVFRENYCHWDVLILDDIQFLGGRVEAQEEFFHIFNVLQQEQRQIIIVGDKPPDRLGLLEQRLVSRFSGGIVCSIRPTEWETRVEILRHHADERNVRLPEELLSLIAMRVPNDNRKMIGALRKVTAYAELVGEAVSCEMANEILNHLGAGEAA